MKISAGVNPPADTVLRMAMLEVLMDHPADMVTATWLFQARTVHRLDVRPEQYFNAVAGLRGEGLLHTNEEPPWDWALERPTVELLVSSRGRQWFTEARAERDDSRLRRQAARDALLGWTYAQELAGVVHPVFDLEATTGFVAFYDSVFTGDELSAAERWLAEGGFVTPHGGVSISCTITRQGEVVMDSGLSVNDPLFNGAASSGGTYSQVTVHGDNHGSVQVAGAGSTQTATTTITTNNRAQMSALADAVDEAMPVFAGQPGAVELRAANASVREAAASAAATPSFAREVVTKLRDELSTRVSGALAAVLAANATSVVLALQGS